ncbi:hypothetical protein [Agrobacterium vaccinii]|uniref:hypothetical protein n=1 Tax=Agrobacterium vaccinii TaxID=2735528 RepID=UPI001E5EB27F|nr:hypothetical protein [Agrobacterium vaccinii]UHS56030.1 hypothetical protein HRS00_03980 [Agrobacterium vaccinii]
MTTKHTVEKMDSVEVPKTCFVIMPISDVDGYPAGHFAEVYKQLIEPAVAAAGYVCSLATSSSAAHMIQLEVVTKVATADLVICDLSNNNPNVLFEYGIRQAFDKPTVLIKDDKTRRIFDLTGFRDIEYDHTLRIAKTLAAREAITTAINDTVSGSEDEEQVFSLVKLMKLTKAALPTGDVSQDDARFTLLENKLDGIVRSLNTRLNRTIAAATVTQHGPWNYVNVFGNKRWEVMFADDRVRVVDRKDNIVQDCTDFDALQETEFWLALGKEGRQRVMTLCLEHSQTVVPF